MQIDIAKQVNDVLARSNRLCILLPQNYTIDTIAAGLALKRLATKLEKEVDLIGHEFVAPTATHFLPSIFEIQTAASFKQTSTLRIPLNNTTIDTVTHEIANNELLIHITPTEGKLMAESLPLTAGHYHHDLIVTVNTPELTALGALYENNPDFFYQTPIVNIDHRTDNEHYGHYNVVSVTATSTCEVVYELIMQIDAQLLDETMATYLLTGLISATQSFRSAQVTPRSLQIASHLVTLGANRDNIINELFRTKSLDVLRLWGIVLQRLQTNTKNTIAWTHATQEDLAATNTTPADLTGILEDIMGNIPSVSVSIIFQENPDGSLQAMIKADKPQAMLTALQAQTPKLKQQLVTCELVTVTPADVIGMVEKAM